MTARLANSFNIQCKSSLVALPIKKKRTCWSSLQAQEQSQAPINVSVDEERDEYEHNAQQPENGTLKYVKDGEDATSTSQNSELTATTMTKEVMNSIKLLKNAAKTRKVATLEVLSALRVVRNAKLNAQNFLHTLGGDESPGRTWMLIFTAQGRSGKGFYFPITAVQRFDASAMRIENGIYLGPIGCLTFEGRFSWKKRILAFIFESLNLKFGPLGPIKINLAKEEDKNRIPVTKDPFFIWFYVDEEIAVAQGRGGGTALWCRLDTVNVNSMKGHDYSD
ncbi:hypothetical protein SUGI_0228250 [Cryptomeria japonica]|nr:hypothetical protein SUGI_0228250 [Cryptomeria japonica]